MTQDLMEAPIKNEPGTKGLSQVAIEHWNSPRYGGDATQHAGMTHTAEVIDLRACEGKLLVNIGDDNGEIDDQLAVAFEVTELPGSTASAAVMMLYEGDDCVLKIARTPNGHLLIPMKPGVQISRTRLPNGDEAWMLTE